MSDRKRERDRSGGNEIFAELTDFYLQSNVRFSFSEGCVCAHIKLSHRDGKTPLRKHAETKRMRNGRDKETRTQRDEGIAKVLRLYIDATNVQILN